jgi:hypothetical protein
MGRTEADRIGYKRAVVIDTGPKKSDERKRSSECMEKFVLKKI